MKFFALILSLYVFWLVSIPCADGANDCSKVKTEQTNDNSSQEDQSSTHDCSPFCICSCCHVNIVLCFSEGLISPIVQFTGKISAFYSCFVPEYTSSFWQPPKIGLYLFFFFEMFL